MGTRLVVVVDDFNDRVVAVGDGEVKKGCCVVVALLLASPLVLFDHCPDSSFSSSSTSIGAIGKLSSPSSVDSIGPFLTVVEDVDDVAVVVRDALQ